MARKTKGKVGTAPAGIILNRKVIPPGEKLSSHRHTEEGYEILDPTPVALPIGYVKQPSLREQIAHAVRTQKLLDDSDVLEETEDDADDFDIMDDDGTLPPSPHEIEGLPSLKQLKKEAAEINAKIAAANRKKLIDEHEKQKEAAAAASKPSSTDESPSDD